jgi:hypothetical protein
MAPLLGLKREAGVNPARSRHYKQIRAARSTTRQAPGKEGGGWQKMPSVS